MHLNLNYEFGIYSPLICYYRKFIECLLCVKCCARQVGFKDDYSQFLPQGTQCTMMPQGTFSGSCLCLCIGLHACCVPAKGLYPFTARISKESAKGWP